MARGTIPVNHDTCEYLGCTEPIECILDDYGDRLAALCQRHKAALDALPASVHYKYLVGGSLNSTTALLEYADCKGIDDEYFLRGKIMDLINERSPMKSGSSMAMIADAINGAGLRNQVAVLLTNLGPRGARAAIDEVARELAGGRFRHSLPTNAGWGAMNPPRKESHGQES